jgi:hypothetical protein
MTLVERIDAALSGREMSYADLAAALWTDPKSHRYQANGGPPGCYMALSAALRRGKFQVAYVNGGVGPANRIVHPRRKQS